MPSRPSVFCQLTFQTVSRGKVSLTASTQGETVPRDLNHKHTETSEELQYHLRGERDRKRSKKKRKKRTTQGSPLINKHVMAVISMSPKGLKMAVSFLSISEQSSDQTTFACSMGTQIEILFITLCSQSPS